MLDDSAGGALVDKTPIAAKTLIANRALNAQQYEGLGQRDLPRKQVNEMAEGMKLQGLSVCGVCSMQGHLNDQCPQLIKNGGWESAKAVGFWSQNQPPNDPYSNTYNPGARESNQSNAKPRQKSGSLGEAIGQIAEFVGQFRDQGRLPSSTIANPKGGFETAKAIMLKSGKQVGADPQASKSSQTEDKRLLFAEETQATPTARVEHPCRNHLPPLNHQIRPRFKQSKKEENEKDILETFRKVQVNIPLLDAIKKVPRYAKFFKELCTTRRRISNKEVVQVDNLIFPADFYVLEMEDSPNVTPLPILLGRPFMKTVRTKIDVFKGTLTMEFDGEIINFNISEAIKFPKDDHSCFSIDAFDALAQEFLDSLEDDPFETIIAQGIGLKPNLAVPNVA
ncbi:uncharacterized protein [Malus domestica]|uniref:uncharacterized protein n=1 Tax=Malus domestica TaxID=3750 RepID=UPI003976D96B